MVHEHCTWLAGVVELPMRHLAVVAVGSVALLHDTDVAIHVRRWVQTVLGRAPQAGRHRDVAGLLEPCTSRARRAGAVGVVLVDRIVATVAGSSKVAERTKRRLWARTSQASV